MILPIVAYGNPVLRKLASPISPDYPQLEKLLEDMWETMYESSGVGLAAPQINKAIRLFIIDTAQMFENMNEDERKELLIKKGLLNQENNRIKLTKKGIMLANDVFVEFV